MMKALFNERRVEAAAEFIAKELIVQFDPENIDGRMQRRIQECQAYKDGLTMGEGALALLRALAMVQIHVSRELGSKHIESMRYEDDAA
jgi:hypothetical protein